MQCMTFSFIFFQGDSAYRLSPWLMVPFPGNNLTIEQNYFNSRHQKVRNIIERCIGVLKARFRCIIGERKLRYHPTRASHIINACATIHNFLILSNYNIEADLQLPNDINGEEEVDEEIDEIDGIDDNFNANVVGIETRNEFSDYLLLHRI